MRPRNFSPAPWLAAAVLFALPPHARAAEPVRVLPLAGATYHVQGIDADARHLWVTSVDPAARKGYLHEFALPGGRLLRAVEVQEGARFHPGGIAKDASGIWLPVAEYRRASSAVIQHRFGDTLALESEFAVEDHIGCVAVAGGELIGGNWDSRKFYIWDLHGKLLREVPNPTDNSYQDLKFDGRYLVASGLLPDHAGAIDWLEWPTLRLARRVKMGRTDRGRPYTQEGMALRGGEVLLLPEDGPSRLYFFRLSDLVPR